MSDRPRARLPGSSLAGFLTRAVQPLGKEGGGAHQDGRRHLGPVPGASLPPMGGLCAGGRFGGSGPQARRRICPGDGAFLTVTVASRFEYLFNFDNTFEIHDDIEVLKRMGMACGLESGSCSPEDLRVARSLVPKALEPYVTGQWHGGGHPPAGGAEARGAGAEGARGSGGRWWCL